MLEDGGKLGKREVEGGVDGVAAQGVLQVGDLGLVGFAAYEEEAGEWEDLEEGFGEDGPVLDGPVFALCAAAAGVEGYKGGVAGGEGLGEEGGGEKFVGVAGEKGWGFVLEVEGQALKRLGELLGGVGAVVELGRARGGSVLRRRGGCFARRIDLGRRGS